jgi:hypothetical protein
VIISNNFAAQGHGITSLGNGGGGGISIQGLEAEITHTTIAENRLGPNLIQGQGLSIGPWGYLPAVVRLNYSNVTNHTEGDSLATAIVVRVGSSLILNQGLFAGNSKDTNASGGPVPPGIITGLSTYNSASSAGYISPGSPNYNYHIRLDSPAKDRASSSNLENDLDNQFRPFDNDSDFGADEYWPFALSVIPGFEIMNLDWSSGVSVLNGGVNHYEVIITCEAGANPPQEGNCSESINVGTLTNFDLTGLSYLKQYSILVNAYDISGVLISSSIVVILSLPNHWVFLPLIFR